MTRVLFLGSKQLGLDCLKRIQMLSPQATAGVLTFKDNADTRSVFPEFELFANTCGLPFLIADNRGHSERLIADFKPDLCLAVGWYWLLGKETLSKVPRGFLGIHNSLLPRYRGAAPLVWAMIRGELEVGFSLFSFTEAMDDGDIWGQRRIQVEATDYISDVLKKFQIEAISLLEDLWLSILDGTARPQPQNHAEATYCCWRNPEDGGINWKASVLDVYNYVRAQSSPYPGAFTYLNGKKLTIWRARLLDLIYDGTPGQVAQVRDEGSLVICGDRRPLLVEQVGLEGSPPVPAKEVLKSISMRLKALANHE